MTEQLSLSQQSALKRGNLESLPELLLCPPHEISRRCKLTPHETNTIIDTVSKTRHPKLVSIVNWQDRPDYCCTTGDTELDMALAGGFRPGMVWELFGEAGVGKTQLALQQALFVQLPVAQGGLSASACYITTHATLNTERLMQLMTTNPLLSPEACSLDDIQTITAPTVPILISILSKILPDLISHRAKTGNSKQVKLVVIDALADLFLGLDKTSTETLVERSQSLVEISTLLHSLASVYNMLILVVNHTTDIFHLSQHAGEELEYKQQARWFGGATTIAGVNSKEASLGLVWANQINARIMMTRTGRRLVLHSGSNKRQKVGDLGQVPTPALASEPSEAVIRRFTIIFSSVGPPCSVDYIITTSGINTLTDTLSKASVESGQVTVPSSSSAIDSTEPFDEWEQYFDDIPIEAYDLALSLHQEQPEILI
ncbi:RAD51b protein [Mycena indigotica]|uniref:RAD51b protein n=1 Tax=Mycena indigotica TaxID=2126181 RepID=A0A8H6VYP7_9AGAR|nr:RAD51b protein [Mycena indigotica]KAF7295128.1 RAD51b protein [Mycena indigotica]